MKTITEKTAFLAGGCFWCVEAIFENLKGVIEVLPGYMGGKTENPAYEEVCTGNTGHAEVIKIIYDPNTINYNQLLEVFFATHNPTTLNRQGADIGTQYRSEIFVVDKEQEEAARKYLSILMQEKVFDDPIVTQISPASVFYPAEDYHKKYFENNADKNPYCQLVVKPKVAKFKNKFNSKLK